ncbi:MAG: NUDIX domain-containing protein [Chloroflexi bacterium]|nr:MAG: NUDIX domain-containing protein [Chloroflexota bacterium]
MEWRDVDGQQVEACSSCGFVFWRNPLVATIVLIETDGRLVAGRRAIDPGYGLWCFPGGFVNEDEHPAAAAVRECQEEVKAAIEISELLGVYHVIRGDGRGMVAIAFEARLRDGEAPATGHEMLEVATFAPGELPDLAFTTHRQALADWKQRRVSQLS